MQEGGYARAMTEQTDAETMQLIAGMLQIIVTMEQSLAEFIADASSSADVAVPHPTTRSQLMAELTKKAQAHRLARTRCCIFYEQHTCSVCLETAADRMLVPCNHRLLCTPCWKKHVSFCSMKNKLPHCPTCKEPTLQTLCVVSEGSPDDGLSS